MTSSTPIYTIGYGSRSIEEFTGLLQQHHIAYLIDVRSKPYSSYKPEFSKNALERQLEAIGIQYVFMGDTLGGQPVIPSCYTPDGKIDYARLREKDFYREGIQRLQKASQQGSRVALMCSEAKPEMCHRAKLIGETLASLGVEVAHIDEKGELISQEEALLRLTRGQYSLFDSSQIDFTSRKSYQPNGETDEGE
jgi:uncharacterized protein (DUF488 family)